MFVPNTHSAAVTAAPWIILWRLLNYYSPAHVLTTGLLRHCGHLQLAYIDTRRIYQILRSTSHYLFNTFFFQRTSVFGFLTCKTNNNIHLTLLAAIFITSYNPFHHMWPAKLQLRRSSLQQAHSRLFPQNKRFLAIVANNKRISHTTTHAHTAAVRCGASANCFRWLCPSLSIVRAAATTRVRCGRRVI